MTKEIKIKVTDEAYGRIMWLLKRRYGTRKREGKLIELAALEVAALEAKKVIAEGEG